MKISDLGNSFKKNKKQTRNDLGFGTKMTKSDLRMINRDGSFNVLRTGVVAWTPYQSLVEMSWARFFFLVTVFYCVVNAFFALLFVVSGLLFRRADIS